MGYSSIEAMFLGRWVADEVQVQGSSPDDILGVTPDDILGVNEIEATCLCPFIHT